MEIYYIHIDKMSSFFFAQSPNILRNSLCMNIELLICYSKSDHHCIIHPLMYTKLKKKLINLILFYYNFKKVLTKY